jgi:hypothetical protein
VAADPYSDIVSLRNQAAPLDFLDVSGKRYYLELSLKADQNTIAGTLSTRNPFRVFEGGQGRAELVGRFTTTPGPVTVPEPSSALMAVFGAPALCRRKR